MHGYFNWENNLKVIHASEPLEHHERIDNNIGFALSFCKWYVKEFLAADRNVLIIPCGQGGSGLGDHRWNKGDDLYSDAVARISHVLTTYSGSDLKAILWHQGEDDVDLSRIPAGARQHDHQFSKGHSHKIH